MIQFANAKINIGLHVLGKRPDQYHELETVFVPVPLYDIVEVIESSENAFECSGLTVPGSYTDNLCIKAYALLKRDFDVPPVHIYLHKQIPVGAGLGGGSADAVATFRCLDRLFTLNLREEVLEAYARQLGSDCAFFVYNRAAFAWGRGEQLQPLSLSLEGYRILLVLPEIHVSTGAAFASLTVNKRSVYLREAISRPLHRWKEEIENDFELSQFQQHPLLGAIKAELYHSGATYAAMSGSGSAVYGIFEAQCLPDLDRIRELAPSLRIIDLDMRAFLH